MADLPTTILYGTVTGFFFTGDADSPDAGNQPDSSVLTGKITVKPTLDPPFIRTPDGLMIVRTAVLQVIGGYVYGPKALDVTDLTPAQQGASLIASTGQPTFNPSDFQYTATFALDGISPQPLPITFTLPPNTTVDLSLSYNTPSSTPAIQVIVDDSSAQAAAQSAQDAAAYATAAQAAGRNFVVLNSGDPIPPGTPANTVIFRKT